MVLMSKPRSYEALANQLKETGHRRVIVVPFVAILLSAIVQLLFTNYYTSLPVIGQIAFNACLLVIVLITLVEVFARKLGRAWQTAEYVLLHVLALLAYLYVLPVPSGYTFYIMLLGIIVFFDFGLMAMAASMTTLLGLMALRYLLTYGAADMYNLTDYLVMLVSVAVMTYYATRFLSIAADELKEVKRTTRKARTNEQQIQSLINNITDGVIAVDDHFRVIMYNAAALDVLDLNTAIHGKPISRFLKPVDENKQPVDIVSLLKQTTVPTVSRDLRIQYKDGSTSNLFIGVAPIYLGYGKSQEANNGFTIILRDITREKSLEEERDEFISVVSHELRTPIAITEGAISNAQFIAEKSGDMEVIKQTLKESHNQVLFLADMINDLSTLSRAERGVLEVEVEPINVPDLVNELKNNYTPQAEAKGLKFFAETDPALALLYSTKLYTREILQNFITNAIKYTEKGSVTLRAMPTDKGVLFEVQDTGIGISKGDQERVYDKFFRSEDFRTRQNNGTGLGLYVTMKLVRLIHAEVSLQSELNKGSIFRVEVPNLEPAGKGKPA